MKRSSIVVLLCMMVLASMIMTGRHRKVSRTANVPVKPDRPLNQPAPVAPMMTKHDAVVVEVWGSVRKAGTIQLDEPATVTAALARCGGPTAFADMKKIKISRRQPDGSLTQITIDLTSTTGKEGNSALQAGDSIFVPEKIL